MNGLMDSTLWLGAGWTMLHFLWVGTLIALLAQAGNLLLRWVSPNVRYAFAVACLLALAVAPAAIPFAFDVTASGAAVLTKAPAGGLLPLGPPDAELLADPGDGGYASPPATSAPRSSAAITYWLGAAARTLPWLWLVGAPAVLITVTTGFVGVGRLRRESEVLGEGSPLLVCRRLERYLNLSRRVQIAVCDRVVSPILIGVVRPVILLPPAALMGWSTEQLEMVLLHELAHVRRWDNLVNLLQRIIESVLFFHPAVWLVSRWVRREREVCCDEIVLRRTGRPQVYARMLVSMASPGPVGGAAVALGEHSLVSRVRRMLNLEDQSGKVSCWAMALAGFAAVVPALAVAAYIEGRGEAGSPHAAVPTGTVETRPAPDVRPGSTTSRIAPRHRSGGFGGSGINNPAPTNPVHPSGAAATPAATGASAAAALEPRVTLRLVDADGVPVEGARLALHIKWKEPGPEFYLTEGPNESLISDADGRVVIDSLKLLTPSYCRLDCVPFVALHEERGLGGTVMIRQEQWGGELNVTLLPLCRVSLEVDSAALRDLGQPLLYAKGFIRIGDVPSFVFRRTREGAGRFEYLIPPGNYQYYVFGEGAGHVKTDGVWNCFTVTPGSRELALGEIDLPIPE